MAYQATTALRKILKLRSRLRIVQGGARAGKTVAILMCLIDMAQSSDGLVISVVSENLPHLKRGAMRDFLRILKEHAYYKEGAWNRTDYIYTFESGSIIEFFGADSASKVHGPTRDVLFINECNNVPFETYRQLALRTSRVIYLDFNPVSEFYVHTDLVQRSDADFIKLTYLDNEGLAPEIANEIELLRSNENLWRIYGLGEIGINEGQIFTDWEIIPRVPKKARKVRYILDYGFTNDPSALGALYKYNGGFVVHELAHAPRLDNRDLSNIIRKYEGLMPAEAPYKYDGQTSILTVADSAEPKSIAEMETYGILITGAEKGADSVDHGIQVVQQQHLYFTQHSTNFIKDFRNYLWKTDKNGKPLNVPEHAFSHAPDAVRYGITDVLNPNAYIFRVRTA